MTSPSSLSSLERCALAHWNAGHDVPATEPDDGRGALVGKAVHAVLAWAALHSSSAPTAEAVHERVRACGVPPTDMEEVTSLAFAGWRRLPPPSRILAVEESVGVDLSPDGSLSGIVDLVVRPILPTGVTRDEIEIWDWKTGHEQLDPDELLCDVQALSYWAWATVAYPGAAVTLRWVYLRHDHVVTARPTTGLGFLHAMLRAEARNTKRKSAPQGRPGAHCAHCEWRSGCASRDAWLGAPFSGTGQRLTDPSNDLALTGALYRHASARAKVSEQERKDLGARLLELLGDEKTVTKDGIKVTRVRTERSSWPPLAVRMVAEAVGIDPAALWEQVGSVRTAALDVCVGKLPVEQAHALEGERASSRSEHVRVSGELV